MKDDTKCGCGREGVYVSGFATKSPIYSCNKYKRCLTREELEHALTVAQNMLKKYQNTVNQIDDYFEYRRESNKDAKTVYKIIGNLTDSLKEKG